MNLNPASALPTRALAGWLAEKTLVIPHLTLTHGLRLSRTLRGACSPKNHPKVVTAKICSTQTFNRSVLRSSLMLRGKPGSPKISRTDERGAIFSYGLVVLQIGGSIHTKVFRRP